MSIKWKKKEANSENIQYNHYLELFVKSAVNFIYPLLNTCVSWYFICKLRHYSVGNWYVSIIVDKINCDLCTGRSLHEIYFKSTVEILQYNFPGINLENCFCMILWLQWRGRKKSKSRRNKNHNNKKKLTFIWVNFSIAFAIFNLECYSFFMQATVKPVFSHFKSLQNDGYYSNCWEMPISNLNLSFLLFSTWWTSK